MSKAREVWRSVTLIMYTQLSGITQSPRNASLLKANGRTIGLGVRLGKDLCNVRSRLDLNRYGQGKVSKVLRTKEHEVVENLEDSAGLAACSTETRTDC